MIAFLAVAAESSETAELISRIATNGMTIEALRARLGLYQEHAARLEYEGLGKIVAPRVTSWPQHVVSSLY